MTRLRPVSVSYSQIRRGLGPVPTTNSSTYVMVKEKSHRLMIKVGRLRIGEVNQMPNKKV